MSKPRVTTTRGDTRHWFVSRRTRRPRVRPTFNPNAPAGQDWLHSVTGLTHSDRKQLFPIIARVCRQIIGKCFDPKAVTSEQREEVCRRVHEEAAKAGLTRVTHDRITGRVDWWISIHDQRKALWFGVPDLARAHEIIASRVSQARLDALNAEHAEKLMVRKLDHFALSLALCGIVKNSLVQNKRTRKGECGTKAIKGLFKHAGISANGTFVKLCFRLLSEVGLIACVDATFEVGKRCRRWTAVGPTWTLPFVADLPDSDLSDYQRAAREAFFSRSPTASQTQVGYSYRIGSSPSQPTTHHHLNYSEEIVSEWYQSNEELEQDEDEGVCVNIWVEPVISEGDDPYMLDEDGVGPDAAEAWNVPADDDEVEPVAPAAVVNPAYVVAAKWEGSTLLATVVGGQTFALTGPAASHLMQAMFAVTSPAPQPASQYAIPIPF